MTWEVAVADLPWHRGRWPAAEAKQLGLLPPYPLVPYPQREHGMESGRWPREGGNRRVAARHADSFLAAAARAPPL